MASGSFPVWGWRWSAHNRESYQQGRFAHVGFPDQGDPDPLPRFFLFAFFGRLSCRRKIFRQVIHQFVDAQAMLCGDVMDPGRSEAVEFGQEAFMAGAVNLVDGVKDGFPRFPQHRRNFDVGGGQAVPPIHEKDHEVGLFNGQMGLFAHLDEDGLRGSGFEASRVDQGIPASVPAAVRVVPVPRGSRHIDDDGLAFMGQPVEQRGFAHVGPSDDGDNGVSFQNLPLIDMVKTVLPGRCDMEKRSFRKNGPCRKIKAKNRMIPFISAHGIDGIFGTSCRTVQEKRGQQENTGSPGSPVRRQEKAFLEFSGATSVSCLDNRPANQANQEGGEDQAEAQQRALLHGHELAGGDQVPAVAVQVRKVFLHGA